MSIYHSLLGKYAGLFGGGTEGDVGEDEEPEGYTAKYEQWSWYVVLDSLSNSDRTKWNYFLHEMNVIEFLNTLAFYKDRQNYLKNMQSGRNAK